MRGGLNGVDILQESDHVLYQDAVVFGLYAAHVLHDLAPAPQEVKRYRRAVGLQYQRKRPVERVLEDKRILVRVLRVVSGKLALDQLRTVPRRDLFVDGLRLLHHCEGGERGESGDEHRRHNPAARPARRPGERASARDGLGRVLRRERHPLQAADGKQRCERNGQPLRGVVRRRDVHTVGCREYRAELVASYGGVHRVCAVVPGRDDVPPRHERIGRDRARSDAPEEDRARSDAFTLEAERPGAKGARNAGREVEVGSGLRTGRHRHVVPRGSERPPVLVAHERTEHIRARRHGLDELGPFAGQNHQGLVDSREVDLKRNLSVGGEYLQFFLHVQTPVIAVQSLLSLSSAGIFVARMSAARRTSGRSPLRRLPPVPHRDGLVEDNEPLVYVPAAPFPEALEELEVLGPKRDVLLPDGREQPQRLPVVDERREKRRLRLRLGALGEHAPQRDLASDMAQRLRVLLGGERGGVHDGTVDQLAEFRHLEAVEDAAEEQVHVLRGLEVLVQPEAPEHVAHVSRIEDHRLAVALADVEEHPDGGDAGAHREELRPHHLHRHGVRYAVYVRGPDVLLDDVEHDDRIHVERVESEPLAALCEAEHKRNVLALPPEHGERVAVLRIRLPPQREPDRVQRHLDGLLHGLLQLRAGLRKRAPRAVVP